MAINNPVDLIVSDPGKRGGQPIIAGTSIRVADVVASYIYRGQSPDELAVNFVLDLGQVYAALAYYYQHKADMDAQMKADTQQAEKLLSKFESKGKLIRVE